MSNQKYEYQDPDEGLFQPSRAQQWGKEPFVIRPPTKKSSTTGTWISADQFKSLDITTKRAYARAFGIPRENFKFDAELDELFCTHNEKLPFFPGLVQYAVNPEDRRSRIPIVLGIDNPTFEPRRPAFSGDPSDPDYAPWVPLNRSYVVETLGDSADDFEEVEPAPYKPRYNYWRDGSVDPEPEAEEAPLPTEHDLVYPPYGLTVVDEATGKHVEQPLSAEWLRIMLDEQATRHATLKASLQDAVALVRVGVTEVAALQMELEAERGRSDSLLKTIEQLAGWEIPRLIEHRAKAGIEKGNIYGNGRPPKEVGEDEDIPGSDGQSEESEEDEDEDSAALEEDQAAEYSEGGYQENGYPEDIYQEDDPEGNHQENGYREDIYHEGDHDVNYQEDEYQEETYSEEAPQVPAAFDLLTPPPENDAPSQVIPIRSPPSGPPTASPLRVSKRSRDDVDAEERASGTLPVSSQLVSDSDPSLFPAVKRKRMDRNLSLHRPGDLVYRGPFDNQPIYASARAKGQEVFDVDATEGGPFQRSEGKSPGPRHSEIHRQGFDSVLRKEVEDKHVDGAPESDDLLARRQAKIKQEREVDRQGFNTGISYHYTKESVEAWEREHGLRPFTR
ncbi:hypothetical protein HYPSUDRAFT_70777 [Hypholoma sublateritium FD-334 SS-4]|uniref:Uncharacterized protein n=1 Tax=Hypholoma sublateritium (strain FD-334 SS-4) TaxID=945553 RepID=A0A0D2NL50_HYPSF|nr:hypothetical protein HYPSUDRAFT_70777 [Hypholoma sublateritium FD-334 SS-4]